MQPIDMLIKFIKNSGVASAPLIHDDDFWPIPQEDPDEEIGIKKPFGEEYKTHVFYPDGNGLKGEDNPVS